MSSNDGKWIVSNNEEVWSDGEHFDTKEEALDYAMGFFASEYGLEDGAWIYVGQVGRADVTAQALASYVIDTDAILEDIDERLYELMGDAIDTEVAKPPKEQSDELELQLAAVLAKWLEDKIPKVFQVDHVEDIKFEQCPVMVDDERCPYHVDYKHDHDKKETEHALHDSASAPDQPRG